MRVQVQPPCFDQPDYIAALVASAQEFLQRGYDHLLFSFHGLPERHMRKSDPTGCHCLATENCCETASPAHATCYRAQCFKTVAAFVEAGRRAARTSIRSPSSPAWGATPGSSLTPTTSFPGWRSEGVKRLLVMCPAFVSDCLETLEEIGLRGRESFLGAGGTEFALIPCLNEHPLWLTALGEDGAPLRGTGGRSGQRESARSSGTSEAVIHLYEAAAAQQQGAKEKTSLSATMTNLQNSTDTTAVRRPPFLAATARWGPVLLHRE